MTREIVEAICREEWPEGSMSPNELVAVVNDAADYFVELGAQNEAEDVSQYINSFALWLGGQDKNIQVYAWQLIRRVKGIDIEADDKTSVRLQPIEDKIFQGDAYTATDFEDITKFRWPKEFLKSFKDRVSEMWNELHEDDEGEETTADLILTGRFPSECSVPSSRWTRAR